jgi:hypothetical protein
MFTDQMLYVFFILSVHATRPAHLTLIYFITLKIFGEEYKFWILLWHFSQSFYVRPTFSLSLLGPNILLGTVYWHPHCEKIT